jgi:hypothetical protein
MLYTVPNTTYRLEALILFNYKVFFEIICLRLKELENRIIARLKAISTLY